MSSLSASSKTSWESFNCISPETQSALSTTDLDLSQRFLNHQGFPSDARILYFWLPNRFRSEEGNWEEKDLAERSTRCLPALRQQDLVVLPDYPYVRAVWAWLAERNDLDAKEQVLWFDTRSNKLVLETSDALAESLDPASSLSTLSEPLEGPASKVLDNVLKELAKKKERWVLYPM